MKLVAAIKLVPPNSAAIALAETLVRCNQAATWLAKTGFDAGVFRQFDLHKLGYTTLRKRFCLTAQAAVRTIAKVADAFKINRDVAPVFRKHAAQPYDDRIIRFVRAGAAVSIWTIEGRITVPVVMGEHQARLMAYRKGEVDLCFVRGKWILAATCDIPETTEFNAEDWLGVDLGIVSLAVDSDGGARSGADVERVRSKLARRRRGIQKRGTKAAKRLLRKLSGKQARFQKHTNHCISKSLVLDAASAAGLRPADPNEHGLAIGRLPNSAASSSTRRNAPGFRSHLSIHATPRVSVPRVAASTRRTEKTKPPSPA